jgi:hypothetical protein
MRKILSICAAVFLAQTLLAFTPLIGIQPVSQTNAMGTVVQFKVTATGGSLKYQWNFSPSTNAFIPIPKATGSTLVRTTAISTIGRYNVRVSNGSGSTTSQVAWLAFTNSPAPPTPMQTVRIWWNPVAGTSWYEIWSTTSLSKPMTLLTNVGLATDVTFLYPQDDPVKSRYFSVKAYALKTIIGTASIMLTWDASPTTNDTIVGYRVYLGSASMTYTNVINAGMALSCNVSNLVTGTPYYFSATAVDYVGLESDYSTEISAFIPSSSTTNVSSVRCQVSSN